MTIEEECKSENERNKPISLIYLFSQPLVERKVIRNVVHEIYPIMVSPIDHYGEYRNLTKYLEKSGQNLSIKSQLATNEAFRDEAVTRCKVLHISCNGVDFYKGTHLEFEMQEFVGSLQKLRKNVINK
jgi:hypothetical protein